MARYVVARVGEIPPGGRKIVDLDGRSVGVFNVRGEYVALLNWCPHQGAPLCQGQLWSALEADVPGEYRTSRHGEIIACLLHGWEFDLRTGQSWCDPERLRVRAYDVQVQPGSDIAGAVDAGKTKVGKADTGKADADEAEDADAPAPGMVKGPYLATMFPVKTEGEYVVVDLGRRAADRKRAVPRERPPRRPRRMASPSKRRTG